MTNHPSPPDAVLHEAPEQLKAIRDALDAGPTPGPWFASNRGSYGVSQGDEGSVYDEYGEDVGAEFVKPIGYLPTIRGELWYRDAAYVAACNPAAMTAVLATIAQLEARLRVAEARRNFPMTTTLFSMPGTLMFKAANGGWFYMNHANTWQSCPAPIDAAIAAHGKDGAHD